MKCKVLITATSLLLSSLSYASLQECFKAGVQEDFKKAIEYCQRYGKENPQATMILGGAYSQLENPKGLDYMLWVANYYQNHPLPNDKFGYTAYTMTLSSIGNIYYFGLDSIPVDHSKGLTYIIESANLGNDIAQAQLGRFYASDEATGLIKYFPKSYMWSTLANLNGNTESIQENIIYQNLNAFKQQGAYCIALGDQLVGNAYAQGIGGLTQSTSKAMDWYQQGYQIDHISPVATTLAQAYLAQGNKTKALEVAQVAIQQPYPQAFVLMAQLSNDPVAQYTYLSIATELYNKPDTAFWDKFEQPCRPELNSDGLADAKAKLNAIKIDKAQQAKAGQMVSEIKKGWQ